MTKSEAIASHDACVLLNDFEFAARDYQFELSCDGTQTRIAAAAKVLRDRRRELAEYIAELEQRKAVR